jgi:hypothetical protein
MWKNIKSIHKDFLVFISSSTWKKSGFLIKNIKWFRILSNNARFSILKIEKFSIFSNVWEIFLNFIVYLQWLKCFLNILTSWRYLSINQSWWKFYVRDLKLFSSFITFSFLWKFRLLRISSCCTSSRLFFWSLMLLISMFSKISSYITSEESKKCWWFKRQCLYAFYHDEKMISSFVLKKSSNLINTNEWCNIIFVLQ